MYRWLAISWCCVCFRLVMCAHASLSHTPERVATSTPFLCGFYIKNPRGFLIPLVRIIHVFILYICKNKELESLQLEKYYKPAIKHQFLQARISLNIVSCGSVSNVSLLLPNANAHLSFTHDMNTLKTYRKIKRSDLRQVWDSVST